MSRAGFCKTPHPHVPRSKRGEKDAPIFTVRRLSPREISKVQMEVFGDETVEFNTADDKQVGSVKIGFTCRLELFKYALLEVALSGWEKVDDDQGKPIPFSKENIDCIDPEIVDELVDIAKGIVPEEEEKNSESPSK